MQYEYSKFWGPFVEVFYPLMNHGYRTNDQAGSQAGKSEKNLLSAKS